MRLGFRCLAMLLVWFSGPLVAAPALEDCRQLSQVCTAANQTRLIDGALQRPAGNGRLRMTANARPLWMTTARP